MTVAVLALQGAFIEHINILNELGINTVEVRQKSNWDLSFDGLIIPGGESHCQKNYPCKPAILSCFAAALPRVY